MSRRSRPTPTPGRSPGRSSRTSERSRTRVGLTSTTSWSARCGCWGSGPTSPRGGGRRAPPLAAPPNQIFLGGDDDQSIYGWRLADVRRLLGLAETALPGLRRMDLVTNYRCPATVLGRAVRLVEHNRERFAKVIRARPVAPGPLILAPSTAGAGGGGASGPPAGPAADGAR